MADPSLGTGIRRAEDSVYYHPTINPLGLPPAGKPQRYKTSVLALEEPPSSASLAGALPVPKPPPLPQGPAPQLALPPPPGSAEPASGQQAGMSQCITSPCATAWCHICSLSCKHAQHIDLVAVHDVSLDQCYHLACRFRVQRRR